MPSKLFTLNAFPLQSKYLEIERTISSLSIKHYEAVLVFANPHQSRPLRHENDLIQELPICVVFQDQFIELNIKR